MQPLSGNQRPDLLTALMHMSLVLRLPRKTHLCRSSSNAPRLPSFLEMPQNPHVFFSLLTRCTIPCACLAKRHLTVQKWSGRACGAFNILTSKCASRQQPRALFRHLNFQKWSEHGVFCTFWLRNVLRASNRVHFFDISTSKKLSEAGVFCTFWLRNVLRAKTACTFSTSQLQKVLRTWGVFSFSTCKCASRHNGVQFFISHLASGLRTRRFSEPTFRPSGATNHWKKKWFAAFLTFRAPGSSFFGDFLFLIFFLLLFSSLLWLFPSLLFHLSILSEVWLLNFLRICFFVKDDTQFWRRKWWFLVFWGYPVSDIYRYICRIIGKLKTTGLFCLGWGGPILEEGTL